jgi:hypothetical protein
MFRKTYILGGLVENNSLFLGGAAGFGARGN